MALTAEQQTAKNKEMRLLVLEALGHSQALANVDFDIGGFKVTPVKLGRVRDHVLASEIKVRYRDYLWDEAKYEAEEDIIYLGNFSINNRDAIKALIIHECTHAMMDRYKFQIAELQSEIIGYVAQMLYFLGRVPSATAPWVSDERDRGVLLPAFRFAKYLTDQRKGLGKNDWAAMKEAWDHIPKLAAGIMGHELYKTEMETAEKERNGLAGYNGVAGWSYTDPDA